MKIHLTLAIHWAYTFYIRHNNTNNPSTWDVARENENKSESEKVLAITHWHKSNKVDPASKEFMSSAPCEQKSVCACVFQSSCKNLCIMCSSPCFNTWSAFTLPTHTHTHKKHYMVIGNFSKTRTTCKCVFKRSPAKQIDKKKWYMERTKLLSGESARST